MKRIPLIGLIFLAASCGKGDHSCSESRGGFLPNYYRVFYKTKDFGGGPVTIEFKNESGGNAPFPQKLSTSYPSGGVSCATTTGVVKVGLTIGDDYTYHAYDNNRQWNGAIPSSCTANSCETIELK